MANFNLVSGGGSTSDSTTDDEEDTTTSTESSTDGGTSGSTTFDSGDTDDSGSSFSFSDSTDDSTRDTGGGGGTSSDTQFTSGTGETSATVEEETTTTDDSTTSTDSDTDTASGDETAVREADFTPEERQVRDQFASQNEFIDQGDIASVAIDEETGEATITFEPGTRRKRDQRILSDIAGSTGATLAKDTTTSGIPLSEFETGVQPDEAFIEREEAGGAGTARDTRFTSGETDQPTFEEAVQLKVALQTPGISPGDVEVSTSGGDVDVELTEQPKASEEQLEALEKEAETASVTVPGFVPVAGGTTISRRFRDVELEQTDEGTIEVAEQERFGDFDIPLPGTDRELEDVTGAAGDRLVSGTEFIAENVVTQEQVDTFSLMTPTPASRAPSGDTGEPGPGVRQLRGVITGAGNIGDQALNLPQETVEFGAFAAQETVSGRGGEFAADVGEAAAGKGVLVAQEASENPARFSGELVGSAIVSAGAIGAAGRVGGPRTARATSVAFQPGEELAIAAARRGAVPKRAATAVPGVRRGQIEGSSKSFLESERGGLELTGPRSSGESEQETTVITSEDLETDLGDPTQPGVRPRAEEAPEPDADDPASAFQRRRRRAQQSEVTRTSMSRIEGVEDERPSPTLEERVPPGFRQRQEAAGQSEVTAGEADLERDSRLFETVQQSEVTAGAQQRLAEAQSAEAVLDDELEASAVETGLEERAALREEVGLEERQETRQEMRQETRQEARLETKQETGVESRSELRRETGVEARREIGIETDVDLDLRPDQSESRRRRRDDDFARRFEFGVASPTEVLEGSAQDIDPDLGDN